VSHRASRRSTRVAAVLALALVAAFAAARVSHGAATINARQLAIASTCGVERWKVKTLQDKPTLQAAQPTTIAALIAQPKPSPLPATRSPFEFGQYRVVAQVTQLIREDDQDLHLVLEDALGNTMIAEAPLAACDRRASPDQRTRMKTARAAVRVREKAEITGVVFFDFNHGQTGVAPNLIELHPIVKFRCLA
jgi:hypothetical protein